MARLISSSLASRRSTATPLRSTPALPSGPPCCSGHTGKIMRPKLFIAAGLSGGIMHRVGFKGAALIVAISIEKNAPTFEFAHIGSDANRLLPAPTAAFVRVCGRIRASRSRARGGCHDRGKVRRHRGRRRDSRHASALPMAKFDMKALRPKRGEHSPAPCAAARSGKVATGFRRRSCINKRD